LSFLSGGYSYREIAQALYISPETVHTHCKRIYRKLRISGRRELIAIDRPEAPVAGPRLLQPTMAKPFYEEPRE
jgi:DNA-binding NarL/FixJ family response regulator